MLVLQEGKPLVLPSVKKAEQKVVNDPSANKVFGVAVHVQHTLCLSVLAQEAADCHH